jgi:hypothetical protein
MATSMAPNKRLDEVYSYIQKLSDEQLAQLIQQNPQSTEATLALGQINSRNEFRQRAQGQQASMPTVREGVLSLPTNQDNSDPRLMRGMGSMEPRPRDSMDTPMSGVAQLPSQAMMAEGGVVGYANGDLVTGGRNTVRRPVEQDYDLEVDDFESDGLNEEQGMLSQAAPYILGGLAVADPALRMAERIQLGGIGSIAKGVRKVGEAYRKRALKGKTPTPTGRNYKAPQKTTLKKRKNESDEKYKERQQAKDDKYESDKKTYEENVAKQNKIKEQNVKARKLRGGRTDKQIVRNKIARDAALATSAAGLGGLTALGYQGIQNMEEAPLETMRGLPEMGPDRGSEAIAPDAPVAPAARERNPNLGNFLKAAGLSYASGKNLGESGIAGLAYMDERKALADEMTDREKLQFARETAIMEAQMEALSDAGLTGTEVKDVLTFKEELESTNGASAVQNAAQSILAQDYNGDLAAFGQAYQITGGEEAIQQKLMEVARDTLVNNRVQSFLSKGANLTRNVSPPDIPNTVIR